MDDPPVLLPPGSCFKVEKDADGNVVSLEPIDSPVEFDGHAYRIKEA